MIDVILALVTLALAAAALWCAFDTARFARSARADVRRAQAANRESAGIRAEVELLNLNPQPPLTSPAVPPVGPAPRPARTTGAPP